MTSKSSSGEPDGTDWLEETIPRSRRFEDTYYSKADGLGETRHVFLQANGLARRFAELGATGTFKIAELGFGTGLNLLATLALWRQAAPNSARLHYLSFERFPLEADAMRRALSRWPQLADDAQTLCTAWQPDFEFFEWQPHEAVDVTIFMSDANVRLPQLGFSADAWFLDGFSPARNPELWNDALMREVFRHTTPGGTFATYTAAGWVRRNLEAAGFEVSRQPGFAGKREMMAGIRLA